MALPSSPAVRTDCQTRLIGDDGMDQSTATATEDSTSGLAATTRSRRTETTRHGLNGHQRPRGDRRSSPALDTPGDSGTQELQANAPDVNSLLTILTQTSENHRDVRIHGAASKLLKSELSSRNHRYRRPAASTITSRSRLQRTRHSQNAPLLHDLASYGAHDDSTGI